MSANTIQYITNGYINFADFSNVDFHNGKISFFGSIFSLLIREKIGDNTVAQAPTIIPTNGSSKAPLENSANTSLPKYLLMKN